MGHEQEPPKRQPGTKHDVYANSDAAGILGDGSHLAENAYNTHESWMHRWRTGERVPVLDVDTTVHNIVANPRAEESAFYAAEGWGEAEIQAYVAERYVRMAIEQGVPFRTTLFDESAIEEFRQSIARRQAGLEEIAPQGSAPTVEPQALDKKHEKAKRNKKSNK